MMKTASAILLLLAMGCASEPPASAAPPAGSAKLDQTPIAAPKFGNPEEEAILRAVDIFLLALGNGDRELQKTVEYSDGSLAMSRFTKDAPGTVRRIPSSQLQQPTPNHDPFV